MDEVFDKIGALARDDITIMLVQQNAARALESSHRGYVLEQGRNRHEGTGQQLLEAACIASHGALGYRPLQPRPWQTERSRPGEGTPQDQLWSWYNSQGQVREFSVQTLRIRPSVPMVGWRTMGDAINERMAPTMMRLAYTAVPMVVFLSLWLAGARPAWGGFPNGLRVKAEYFVNPDGSTKLILRTCGRHLDKEGHIIPKSPQEILPAADDQIAGIEAIADLAAWVNPDGWGCIRVTGYAADLSNLRSTFRYRLEPHPDGLKLEAKWDLLDLWLQLCCDFTRGIKPGDREQWVEQKKAGLLDLSPKQMAASLRRFFLYNWRFEQVLHLPGTVVSSSNFRTIDAKTLQILVTNWNMIATVRMTAQEHVLREMLAADSDAPGRRRAMKILFGADAPIHAVLVDPLTPLFDYRAEVAAAQAAEPALFARLGLDGRPARRRKEAPTVPRPVRVAEQGPWRSAAAGDAHTVALKADGSLWAWGRNDQGQLGVPSSQQCETRLGGKHSGPCSRFPIRVGAATDWTQLAAGREHTVALKADGTLWAWGGNRWGQLGTSTGQQCGRFARPCSSLPLQVGASSDWQAVSAGSFHTVALKKDGTLWAWGSNVGGQLGVAPVARCGRSKVNNCTPVPIQVGEDSDWQSVTAGPYHTLALKSDGSLWAWGKNPFGELGLGVEEHLRQPVRVGSRSDWAAVTTGENHSLALRKDGSLWAWGLNRHGQLGERSPQRCGSSHYRCSRLPLRVGGLAGWAAVVAGRNHSLAVRSDGSLWAWGSNEAAQVVPGAWDLCEWGLYLGNIFCSRIPIRVGSDITWRAAAAGSAHTVAIAMDGSLWAWGSNEQGQLGLAP